MGHRTERKTCTSCGGAGGHQRTDWVSNYSGSGPTTVPVYRRETCFICGGTGYTTRRIYVADAAIPHAKPKKSNPRRGRPAKPLEPLTQDAINQLRKSRAEAFTSIVFVLAIAGLFAWLDIGLAFSKTKAAWTTGAIVLVVILLLAGPLKVLQKWWFRGLAFAGWAIMIAVKVLGYALAVAAAGYLFWSLKN